MKGNIPNHPNYHITKEGRLFSNKSGGMGREERTSL